MMAEAGRDLAEVPVTAWGVQPDYDRVRRYEEQGVSRGVAQLAPEPADKTLPLLDRWAEIIRRLRAIRASAQQRKLCLPSARGYRVKRSCHSEAEPGIDEHKPLEYDSGLAALRRPGMTIEVNLASEKWRVPCKQKGTRMIQQRRFTKEFQEEAVRLVQTSGRTQREIAADLGIGQSTLVRWLGQNRDRRAAAPSEGQNDVTAELKRLRRENEILRQERDILKKATAFFAREGNR